MPHCGAHLICTCRLLRSSRTTIANHPPPPRTPPPLPPSPPAPPPPPPNRPRQPLPQPQQPPTTILDATAVITSPLPTHVPEHHRTEDVALQMSTGRVVNRGNRYSPGAIRQCGSGNSPASHRNLALYNSLLFLCEACGCLTDYHAAIRIANAGGRSIKPGDGCASKQCSPHFRPSRFNPLQLERARDLRLHEGGTQSRFLIRDPNEVKTGTVTLANSDDTSSTATAITQRFTNQLPPQPPPQANPPPQQAPPTTPTQPPPQPTITNRGAAGPSSDSAPLPPPPPPPPPSTPPADSQLCPSILLCVWT